MKARPTCRRSSSRGRSVDESPGFDAVAGLRCAVTLAAAPSLSRWTLHFRDEALEQRYRESEDPKTVRAGRVAAVGGLIFTIVPAILLIAFVPDGWLPNKYVALTGIAVVCAVFLLSW